MRLVAERRAGMTNVAEMPDQSSSFHLEEEEVIEEESTLKREVKLFLSTLYRAQGVPRPGSANFEASIADAALRDIYKNLSGSTSSMQQVMKICFTTLASSATPERVFSCAGLVDNALRANLGEEKLEKLVVLGFYLNNIEKNEGSIKKFIQEIKNIH